MNNKVPLNFDNNIKLPLLNEKSKYSYALNDLSVMADIMEEKDKIIEQKNKIIETLAWKVDVLSKVILKAGINIDDYLSIEEVAQYTVREEAE